MKPKGRTAFFGGQARLPKELSASEVFQAIAEVDLANGRVVEVEFYPCPDLMGRVLKQMMVGMVLPGDLEDLLQEIELRLYYKGKKAVLTAVKDMVREYKEYLYRAAKGGEHPSTKDEP